MGFMDRFKAALPIQPKLPPPPASAPKPAKATKLRSETFEDEVAVVGTSNYQKALQRVSGWTKTTGPTDRYLMARIEFEPTNPHDKNAIMVTVNGQLIGYIAKSDHRLMMHRVRDAGGSMELEAVIVGGTDGKSLGARLRL